MVKVSVIIPSYNSAKFLKKTISSVYNQTLNEIEVICVDDGSTDNSLKVLKRLQRKYSSLKVISQKNQGPGMARNNALKIAKGEYVAFLDSDDIFIDEDSLKEMYDFAKKENLNMISANLSFVDKKYNIKKDNHHYENGDYCYFDEYCIISPFEYGIPYGFTKAIFNLDFLKSNNIKFPDYPSGEDPIFLAKIFANLSQIGGVPLTIYGYNHTVGGGVNKKINTYTKKKFYVNHFKIVCDILDDANLHSISNEYKNHLFRYLIWNNNFSDNDLILIFNEIYGDVNEDYFDKNDEEFMKFYIHYKSFFLYDSNSNQFFDNVKGEFLDLNVYSISKIRSETLHKYLLVIDSNSIEEFKTKYDTVKIKKLKDQSVKLKKDKINAENKYEKLTLKYEEINELNESLLQSTSWKISKPLRKVIKLFK